MHWYRNTRIKAFIIIEYIRHIIHDAAVSYMVKVIRADTHYRRHCAFTAMRQEHLTKICRRRALIFTAQQVYSHYFSACLRYYRARIGQLLIYAVMPGTYDRFRGTGYNRRERAPCHFSQTLAYNASFPAQNMKMIRRFELLYTSLRFRDADE